jgi:hypothetical protein
MRVTAWTLGMLLLVSGFIYEAQAATVTETSPIRVDFTFPPFVLPVPILSQGVNFGRDNLLNLGEGYEVLVFDALGNFLGSDSYTNVDGGGIGGCACTDPRLNPPLTTASGYLILRALSGSFNVTEVFVSSNKGAVVVGTISRSVAIDIKPHNDVNRINLHSAGLIPVAILSSATFDARQVDPATVRLAGAGVSLIGKSDKHSYDHEDVNNDGLLDLVCRVRTANFMIEEGDSIAVLEAQTFTGERIRGEDSIEIGP